MLSSMGSLSHGVFITEIEKELFHGEIHSSVYKHEETPGFHGHMLCTFVYIMVVGFIYFLFVCLYYGDGWFVF